MHALIVIPFYLALSGCTIALYGHETAGGSTTSSTTSAALRAEASTSNAKVISGFGTPAPRGAPGGQVVFSRGASAVLVLGLVIAETVNYFSGRFSEKPQPAYAPARSIADTCSCYGYRPPSDEDRGLRIEDRGSRIED